jgi:adenine-specific DNA-methyltransferase
MAGFFEPLPDEVHLLDPGVGALCSAFAVKALSQPTKIKRLCITAWEIDISLIPLLNKTLDQIRELCLQYDVEFESKIEVGDFIQNIPPALENGPLFGGGLERYNCVIINPPYGKINSDSNHRKILSNYGLETVNFYIAFLWLATKDLKLGGQLVSINPRSFANGPYYYPFRKAFLDEMTIRCVHLFNSRKDSFKDDAVLQENLILHAIKEQSSTAVTITSTDSVEDLVKERRVQSSHFVDRKDPELFLHLVSDEKGGWIRQQMLQFKSNLQDIGISVSTGRVVDFL